MALRTSLLGQNITASTQRRAYSALPDRSIPQAKRRYVPTSGEYPKGFLAGSSHAGVKASNHKYDDVALLVSDRPCAAAALFTRNIFKAAPVTLSQAILRERRECFRGVVVNSGNANAVTGAEGSAYALEMVQTADRCLAAHASRANSASASDTAPRMLVMSTRVIGQKLPIGKITAAIPEAHAALGATHAHWMSVAQAICTTDTFPKLASRAFKLPSDPGTEYTIAGTAKGAGMLHPNMGTLLTIVCTDVNIAPSSIKQLLKHATDLSFNCISVDGDTSTNDTIALFANGAAAPANTAPLAVPSDCANLQEASAPLTEDARAFASILTEFLTDLAKLVVRDGEGATKFVTVRVQSATSVQAARRAASSIATSSLVKAALYGRDANWGRILCAVGYAPGIVDNPMLEIRADMDGQVRPSETSVSFIPTDGGGELLLLKRGEPQDVDEERAKQILEMKDLEILVRLNDVDSAIAKGDTALGDTFEATYWTCDLSHEYVTINADYRT